EGQYNHCPSYIARGTMSFHDICDFYKARDNTCIGVNSDQILVRKGSGLNFTRNLNCLPTLETSHLLPPSSATHSPNCILSRYGGFFHTSSFSASVLVFSIFLVSPLVLLYVI